MKDSRVSIIDDCEMHSQWLKSMLFNNPCHELVSIDHSGRAGIESVKAQKSTLVLLDFKLNDLTGLEVAKRIKAYNSSIKIFMLTAYTKASIVDRIFFDKNIDALAIKGSYYFESNLSAAMNHVLGGDHYLDPSLLTQLRQLKNQADFSKLTHREFEVCVQLNMGKSDHRIANDLCVEVEHIKNMKSRILKKMKNENVYALLS